MEKYKQNVSISSIVGIILGSVMDVLPPTELIPLNCETHLHRNKLSIAGYSQINYELSSFNI
jgi:hypothetical protein